MRLFGHVKTSACGAMFANNANETKPNYRHNVKGKCWSDLTRGEACVRAQWETQTPTGYPGRVIWPNGNRLFPHCFILHKNAMRRRFTQ